MVRLLSYNVHRCVGTDRKLDVGRIAAVIAAEEPDIVCLQEVDVGRARTGGVDQAHRIAERLGMKSRFHAALRVVEEEYGDAILTALPETLVKAGPLPGYARIPQLEPRGALWVEVEVAENQRLQVINTHLGLVPREQQLQAVEIAGPGWLASGLRRSPLALVGDFNAPPRSVVYRTFSGKLTDAEKVRPKRTERIATFPSQAPVLRIDHVFVDSVSVTGMHVPATPLARVASDHRPLVVDLRL